MSSPTDRTKTDQVASEGIQAAALAQSVDESFIARAEKVKGIGQNLFVSQNNSYGQMTATGGVIVQQIDELERIKQLKTGYNALLQLISLSLLDKMDPPVEGEVTHLNLESGRLTYVEMDDGRPEFERTHTIDVAQCLLKLPFGEREKIQDFATELLRFQNPEAKTLETRAFVKGAVQFKAEHPSFSNYPPDFKALQDILANSWGKKPEAEERVKAFAAYFDIALNPAQEQEAARRLELIEKTGLLEGHSPSIHVGVLFSLLSVDPKGHIEAKLSDAAIEDSIPRARRSSTKTELRKEYRLQRERLIAECRGNSMDPVLRGKFIDFFTSKRLPFPVGVDLDIFIGETVLEGFTTDGAMIHHLKSFDMTDEEKQELLDKFAKTRGPAYREGLVAGLTRKGEKATVENLRALEDSLATEDDLGLLLTCAVINPTVFQDLGNAGALRMEAPEQKKLAKEFLKQRKAVPDATYDELRNYINVGAYDLPPVAQVTPAEQRARQNRQVQQPQPCASVPGAAPSAVNASGAQTPVASTTQASTGRIADPFANHFDADDDNEVPLIRRSREERAALRSAQQDGTEMTAMTSPVRGGSSAPESTLPRVSPEYRADDDNEVPLIRRSREERAALRSAQQDGTEMTAMTSPVRGGSSAPESTLPRVSPEYRKELKAAIERAAAIDQPVSPRSPLFSGSFLDEDEDEDEDALLEVNPSYPVDVKPALEAIKRGEGVDLSSRPLMLRGVRAPQTQDLKTRMDVLPTIAAMEEDSVTPTEAQRQNALIVPPAGGQVVDNAQGHAYIRKRNLLAKDLFRSAISDYATRSATLQGILYRAGDAALDEELFRAEEKWIDEYKKVRRGKEDLSFAEFVDEKTARWAQVKRFVALHTIDQDIPETALRKITFEFMPKLGKFLFHFDTHPLAYERINLKVLKTLPSFAPYANQSVAALDVEDEFAEFDFQTIISFGRDKIHGLNMDLSRVENKEQLERIEALYNKAPNKEVFIRKLDKIVNKIKRFHEVEKAGEEKIMEEVLHHLERYSPK